MYNSLAYYKFTLQDALRIWHPRLSEMYRFSADLDLVLRRIDRGGEWDFESFVNPVDSMLPQTLRLGSICSRRVMLPRRLGLERRKLR